MRLDLFVKLKYQSNTKILSADLAQIVADHGLLLHQYADDSQIYGFCRPAATSHLSFDITDC